MRRLRKIAWLTAVAVVAMCGLTGCGGVDVTSKQQPVTVTQTVSETTKVRALGGPTTTTRESQVSPATETRAPITAPSIGDLALRVGETREGVAVQTTVVEVLDDVPSGRYQHPDPGDRYFAADVKSCVRPRIDDPRVDLPLDFSEFEWVVATTDGGQYQAAGIDFLQQPAYPPSAQLAAGECLRGWVTFEVPKGSAVDRVTIAPGGERIADWLVD